MGMSLDDLQLTINEEKQSHFDKLHSAELANISRNFTEDEHMDIAKTISSKILTEEIFRREKKVDEIIEALAERARQTSDDMTLIDKEQYIADIRQIVRVQ